MVRILLVILLKMKVCRFCVHTVHRLYIVHVIPHAHIIRDFQSIQNKEQRTKD